MASSVDAKLLRATKFPPEFNQKVDMQKVNLQVMKKWIASKISEILGSEDDVVTELCFNLIEGSRYPDIKSMQIQLTGFLDKDTASFCKDLWNLCLSAQSSPQGVPKELLEAKKLELIQEKIDADKAAEESRIRRETQERRDQALYLVPDHLARLVGVAGELLIDHLPHLVTVPGGVDRHLAIELQESEIGLQGEREVIGPVETVAEEIHLRRQAPVDPVVVDLAHQHLRDADTQTRSVARGLHHAVTVGG
ncbi:hypothetical protein GL218_06802 [Daldinia childiae]|uniref:uncharacterized protein n=1 Tax=Daldinia childiae TaxID=326645 RepID=UPI001448366B|nr:uncharacterized protein GL218_06802 [Daldinia childiae]KAF3056315.1 hypothetical protein GL218_06802 [Daldinia childiae]